jgi:hypothetical protein
MNRKYIYTIIALFSVSLLVFNACKKESKGKLISNQIKSNEDEEVAQLIKNFNHKIKTTTFKESEELSIDSAIWYIEADINYYYCYADSDCDIITIDTTIINLTSEGENISYTDMQQSISIIETNVLNMYYQINNQDAIVLFSDVSLVESANKTDSHSLQVLTIYGMESQNSNSGDDCYGGYSFNTSMDFEDAADVFQNYINNPLCNQPAYDYVTNIEWRNVHAYHINYNYVNPNDYILQDNSYDYLIFYQYEPWLNGHETMNAAELNFYFHQMYQTLIPLKLNEIESSNPTGRSFVRAIITTFQTTAPINQTEWGFYYNFEFGNKRVRNEAPGNPIDL